MKDDDQVMQCQSCNSEIPADSAFCPQCAAPAVANADRKNLPGDTEIVPNPNNIPISGELEPGSVFHERYTIERRLGAGGMGVVYLAHDTVANEQVALKLINTKWLDGEAAVQRLIDEGVLTRKIRHPDIVAVHDVGRDGAHPFVIMEYLDGESLRVWFSSKFGPRQELGFAIARKIVESILAGLGEAHRAGVIHRDLKPENIVLLGEPSKDDVRLKIVDFGIAKAVKTTAFTSSAASLGSVGYMAPEQKTSPDGAGPEADLYSLSRIFYELLMGVIPDGGWQPPSQYRSDVSGGIDRLIEKGLSNRPQSRQRSVDEYLDELKAAIVGPGVAPAKPPTDKEPGVMSIGGMLFDRRTVLAVAGGVGIAGIIGYALEQRPSGETRRAEELRREAERRGLAETERQRQAEAEQQRRQEEAKSQTPRFSNLSGTWRDSTGFTATISHAGRLVSGSYFYRGRSYRIEGRFTGTRLVGNVIDTSNGVSIGTLTGNLQRGSRPSDIDIVYSIVGPNLRFNSTFHINH